MSLEDLRQKPLATRRKIAWALTGSIMFIICAIGFTLPDLSHNQENKPSGKSPIESLSAMFSDVKERFGNPFNSKDGTAPDPETSELIFQLINNDPGVESEGMGTGASDASNATTSENTLENEGFPMPPTPSNPDEFML